MNTKLLEKVRDHVLEEPKRLDMGGWLEDSEEAPCGTVGCIAGWTVALKHPKQIRQWKYEWYGIVTEAMKLLKLTDEQADRLFYARDWPLPFRAQWANAQTAGREAKVTAARITHFIKTGGKE